MRDTSGRGDLTEIEIMSSLIRAGRRVLRPISSASRYDLAIDNRDGTVIRVQCKRGVLRNGAIVFRVCSVSGHATSSVPYQSEVDAFAVFCEATRGVYLIPFSAVTTRKTMVSLRVMAPRNGQRRGTRSAEDFRIG